MRINIGTPERLARIVLGLILLAVALLASLSTLWTWVLVVVGLVLVVTGIVRFCPAWAVFGINTAEKD